MCLSPISLPVVQCGRVVEYNIVPCGKCVECVDRKQKDMMQVFLNVAKRSRNIVFATFTYNDEHLPQMFSLWDFAAGRAVQQSFVRSDLHPDDNQDIYAVPSLRRLDWRLWIKRARVAYERKHGYKLDFTYATIGEYGKLHQRPHYHTMFFDASLEDITEFVSSWPFGFSLCEQVKMNQSLTSVCRYMAKYLYKGFFDADDVLVGLSERPRVMASKNLLHIDDDFKDWLTGKDLGVTLDTVYLKPEVAQRLLDRRKILIDDFNYRLGNHYINKIFKRYEIDSEGKRKLVSTPLQVALADFIRKRADSIRDRELGQIESMPSREAGFALLEAFRQRDEASLQAREDGKCKTLQEYYKRSSL